MSSSTNPFDAAIDPDRSAIWAMLVQRDIGAFVDGDWAAVAGDFAADRFFAIEGGGSLDPDRWGLEFPDLSAYRDAWLKQSDRFRADFTDPGAELHRATTLDRIEIAGDHALAHKRFDHVAVTVAGRLVPLQWRTVYQCIREAGSWRIAGFVGYLPLGPTAAAHRDAVQAPRAQQHVTAGAYSPVLSVHAADLVVISGQAALDSAGAVTSDDLAQQTRDTIDSCARQLAAAGVGLQDVFKVNAYLADIDDWAEFNAAYQQRMPRSPLPVRTAVGVRLLPGLRVELEMWAARP